MNLKYAADRIRYRHMTTAELRDAFLVDDLFAPGGIRMTYCETERVVLGGAMPADEPLILEAGDRLAADHFLERREAGIVNLGGTGIVTVDGKPYPMDRLDVLYVGRGREDVRFENDNGDEPACFYIASYPAHRECPTTLVKNGEARSIDLGSQVDANRRTIHQCIHPEGAESCQLVMGYTRLAPGSVWNTMPPHQHARRTEVYLYFDLDDDARVMHFLGEPEETRHVTVRNGEAVVSPMWSIHSGVGLRNYGFVWAMGGENLAFDDMDGIEIDRLR